MTKIISSVKQIKDRYKIIYCDLWGCLHNGRNVYPDAISAISYLKNKGIKIILLTNSPRTKKFVRKQITKIGVPKNCYDEIVTSGDASISVLKKKILGEKIFHIGPERDINFFRELEKKNYIRRVPLNEATGIVCTGLFNEFKETPKDYFKILSFSRQKGLKFLCVNPDIRVNFGDRELWCAGSIAEIYSKLGGEVLLCGKPHKKIYELTKKKLLKKFNEFSKDILCIGDGLNTDIKGGFDQGFETLFVCSGIYKNEIGISKNYPCPEKKQLDFFLKKFKQKPTMTIGYLK